MSTNPTTPRPAHPRIDSARYVPPNFELMPLKRLPELSSPYDLKSNPALLQERITAYEQSLASGRLSPQFSRIQKTLLDICLKITLKRGNRRPRMRRFLMLENSLRGHEMTRAHMEPEVVEMQAKLLELKRQQLAARYGDGSAEAVDKTFWTNVAQSLQAEEKAAQDPTIPWLKDTTFLLNQDTYPKVFRAAMSLGLHSGEAIELIYDFGDSRSRRDVRFIGFPQHRRDLQLLERVFGWDMEEECEKYRDLIVA